MIYFDPALHGAVQAALAAVFGLIFGSFITALSYRLPRGISIARGRSACPSCGASLTARDLVPVVSWLAHKGRCRRCKASISWRYPAIELLTAILFAVAVLVVEDPVQRILILAATPVVIALAVIDVEHHRLPNSLLIILAGISAALCVTAGRNLASSTAIAAAVFACALLLDWGVRRGLRQPGLGMGDAKLLFIVALALPLEPFLIVLTAGSFLGVLTGLSLRALRGANVFPFGPAILLSMWVGLMRL